MFPDGKNPLRQTLSLPLLSQLGESSLPLVLKKAKGVYLYDRDGNKFLDFFLQNGEAFFGHSPKACTKYYKNALSSGLHHAGGHTRFALKAEKLWKLRLQQNVSLHNNILEAMCSLIKHLEIRSLSYSNDYTKSLLQALSGLIPINPNGEFRFFEPALGETGDCAVHSRFYLRAPVITAPYNILHASPFGGNQQSIIFGENSPPSSVLSFASASLLMEGAKFKIRQIPLFDHPLVENHGAYALLKKEIDSQKALESGLIIKNSIIFFSPLHTENDLRRLKKFLDCFL